MVKLDTSGFNCPIPIIKAKKELNTMEVGESLELISTDPGAVSDIESLCNSLNHELVKSEEKDNKFYFEIVKQWFLTHWAKNEVLEPLKNPFF